MAISCSSDSPDIQVASEGSKVTFDVKDLTRASTTLSFDHFAVYGDMTLIATDLSSPTKLFKLFNGTEVVKTADGWQYQGTRYWFPDYEYSFVAIYPLTLLDTDNNLRYSDSELSFTYTLPLTDEGQVNDNGVADILTSTHRRLYLDKDVNTVTTFHFAHLFSQINFTLELNDAYLNDDGYFKIHKLEMSGFGISTSINIKPASRQSNAQTDDSELNITTNQASQGMITRDFTDLRVINGTESKLFSDNDAIIMLPQTFTADTKVNITLTYSVNEEEKTTQVSASLSDFEWESGKSYNYKFKLGADMAILLINGAEIKDWILVDDHDEVDAI